MNLMWCFLLLHHTVYSEAAFKGKCKEDEFQCTNVTFTLDGTLTQCIPIQYYCDFSYECSDHSDEVGCKGTFPDVFLTGTRNITDLQCLRRHDIYGQYYNSSTRRSITENGEMCTDSPCLPYPGYGIMCSVGDSKHYCHIPFCGIGSLSNRLTCDFTISLCGWNIRSNTRFRHWISEEEGLMINVTGNGPSVTGIASPISVYDSVNYMVNFSIKTTDNILWTFDKLRSKGSCTDCRIITSVLSSRVALPLWIYGNSEYEVILSIAKCEPYLPGSSLLVAMDCKWNEFPCSNECRPADILYDGIRDCSFDNDEGIISNKCSEEGRGGAPTPFMMEDCRDIYPDCRSYRPSVCERNIEWSKSNCAKYCGFCSDYQCSNGEIKCNFRRCLSSDAPSSLKKQCLSNSTTFPYQNTSTKCPSDYVCKKAYKLSQDICLGEEEICDGVSQCPYFDDEIGCSQWGCPPDCSICKNNIYRCIPSAIANIPSDASSIDVSGYHLNLSILCSLARVKLLSLNLSNCGLDDITCISFKFPNLMYLDVSNNNLVFPFVNPGNGFNIILDGNPVVALVYTCAFPNFQKISLRHSSIKDVILGLHSHNYSSGIMFLKERIPTSKFIAGPILLKSIDLSDNMIESIWFLSTSVLSKTFFYLNFADISRNHLRNLTYQIGQPYILHLLLYDNFVAYIAPYAFTNMINLRVLNLSWNRIESIASPIFFNNRNLRELYLQSNILKHLHLKLFSTLTKLEMLMLQNNTIEDLQPGIFKNLDSLKTLQLSNNRLRYISRGVFSSLTSLKTLNLIGNEIAVRKDIFFGLSTLHSLKVDRWPLCCVRPKQVSFENCQASPVSISSCAYLLQSGSLGVYLWYALLLILCGNIHFIYSQRKNGFCCGVRNVLVHLSVAHMVVCISILGMVYKDIESRGEYGLNHEEWIKSSQCQVIKVLSAIGIEATAIFSLVISVRKMSSSKHLEKKQIVLLIVITWIYVFTMTSVYFILRKFAFTPTSSFEQICVLMPMLNQGNAGSTEIERKSTWVYAWITTHIISFIGIVASKIVMMKKYGLAKMVRKMKDPLMLSGVITAVRDLIICVAVYVDMVMVTQAEFVEMILCLIQTTSALHIIIVIFIKQEQIFNVIEIIPGKIQSNGINLTKSNNRVVIVFDRVLRGRIPKKDIAVVFSDGSGWKETSSKLKILKKILICQVPVYKGNINKDFVDVIIKVWNKSNWSCIARSSVQYDAPQHLTTKF